MNHNDIPSEERDLIQGPGRRLRAERERQSLDIDDIVSQLKLSRRQIEALEHDRYHDLPGTTFVRGFIRNYAKQLGLDAEPLLHQLETVLPREAEPVQQVSGPKLRLTVVPSYPSMPDAGSSKMVLGFIAAALVSGAVVYYILRPAHEPELQMSEPSQAQQSAVAVVSVPLATPAPVEATPATAAPDASAAAAAPSDSPAEQSAQTVTPPAAPVAAAPTDVPAKVEPAPRGAGEIKLVFEGEAWVDVKDGDDKRVVSRLFKPGSEEVVTGKPPFKLIVGNAAQVKLTYNGQPVDLTPKIKVNVARFELQ
ncbi:RodZ domain-containing protein [Chitinivorax sp. PXF-14]|uniref:helix-turn-helix domain-containing protein n=1 Tax=Chitinivorax sp. PXF-14 TaxID=3230488 RepID=UPI0034658694